MKTGPKSKVQKTYLTFPNIFHTYISFQTISTSLKNKLYFSSKIFLYGFCKINGKFLCFLACLVFLSPILNNGRNGTNHGQFRKSWEVMRQSWEIHEKLMRKSWVSQKKAMKQSWYSHEKVKSKSWESHEKVIRKSWEIYEKVPRK